MKQRVLVVAMGNSVHTAGWINLARSVDRQIFLLSAYDLGPNENLHPVTRVTSRQDARKLPAGHIGLLKFSAAQRQAAREHDGALGYTRTPSPALPRPGISPDEILLAVDLVNPDVVHTMETQLAGYLTFEAKRRRPEGFPPWLHSNWGSDLYFFSKLREHEYQLRLMMKSIDYYTAECSRDLRQALAMGFRGQVIGPIPNTAGLEPDFEASMDRLELPSRRRAILVKGYHGWTGRAMTALAALRLVEDALSGYAIVVTNPESHVSEFAEQLARHNGLDIECIPWEERSRALRRMCGARIAIGVGLSDGISTTMLEAMAVGTFPIQSSTSCAKEWIEHGRTGFIVSPHDTREIADCIAEALSRDNLVDEAARINQAVIAKKWCRRLQSRRIDNIYKRITIEESNAAEG